VGTPDNEEKVKENDQAEDDKGADLKPHRQIKHG
jgi:hypothetical protein